MMHQHCTCPIAQSAQAFRGHDVQRIARALLKTVIKQLCPQIKYVTAKHMPEQLGEGAYGIVWDHPTDPTKVIKVCWRSPRYIEYLAWCWAHKTNPHVPRIDSIQVIRNTKVKKDIGSFDDPDAGSFAIITMEKLDPEGTISTDRFRVAMLEMFWGRDCALAENPAIKELGEALREMFRAGYSLLDLHGGNCLSRGGKVPVLTDPIAG